MKKIYLSVVLFLSLFSFHLFANGVNINNTSPNSKGNTSTRLITHPLASKKSFFALANSAIATITICEGDNLTLSANPSGGVAPYTFSWTGPNGFTSNAQNPLVNNAAVSSDAGNYIVTITDSASATFQNTTTVVVNTKVDPTFDATLPAICKGGAPPLLSTTSTNGITGTWNPSVVNNNTTTTYLFTPDPGQCANPLSFTIFVVNNVAPVFTLPASICLGDTPPVLSTISNNGIMGTWSPSVVSNTTPGTYTFTPSAGQCATTKVVNININPLAAVFLPPHPPICAGDVLTPLATTSTNGVAGTWSPALDNTKTTTYTFTPTPGQCATATTNMTIVVNPITATFAQVAPICAGNVLNPLPTTSLEGILGSWSPALDNTQTKTYTFTPTAGQCATATTNMTIVVNQLLATFAPVSAICAGDVLNPLPTTSINGITGTWSPALDNTKTTTYNFTPDSGQCATTTVPFTIVVNPITATFAPVAPICAGDVLPALPTTSLEGILGSWSPVLDNTQTKTYTFTPTAGQCATATTSLTISVIPKAVPTFDPIPNVCYGSSTIPTLPTTSNNGIHGTWNSAISNTASAEYTFTPDSGLCATIAKLNVVVTTITPTFNLIAPICQGTTAPILQTTSNNSITGQWNPATIDTSISGTTTYTFTPDPGQCSLQAQINITTNPLIATFNPVAAICAGDILTPLPTTSINGITGVWSPALDNTQTKTYTFTPDAGQCATATVPLTINVTQKTVPTFTAIAPICSGSTVPVLPTTSNNAIAGSWNPTTISNTTSGTYIFTPRTGLCASSTSITVTIYQSPTAISLTTSDVVNDKPEGTIKITGITGGLSPYQYSVNNSLFTSETSYSNLPPGNYTITVKDSNGCEFSKVATVNSLCVFPNAISPNGDEYNQKFNLKGCKVAKLELFNRYGRKVNSYGNYTDQWDGTNSTGEALPDGTYFYVAEMEDGTSKSGWVFIAK